MTPKSSLSWATAIVNKLWFILLLFFNMNQKASFACIETNDKNLQAFSSDHGQSFVHIRIETLLFWFNIL